MIRQIKTEELPQIGAIGCTNWLEVYRGLVSEDFLQSITPQSRTQYYRNHLSHKGSDILVETAPNGIVIAFAAYLPDKEVENCLLLDSLHVHPNYRGTGIGTKLIHAVKEKARRTGYQKLSICVVKGNHKARELYTKLGAVHYDFHPSGAFGTEYILSEKLLWKSV